MTSATSQKKILVVDDDPDLRLIYSTELGALGFEITQAADGSQALEFIQKGARPDLILTDLRMRPVDGFRFIATLRQSVALAAVPIVIVSGEPSLAKIAATLNVAGYYIKAEPHQPPLGKLIRSLLE